MENETVDSFVIDLDCMAEHCQFGDINDELIRYRLVFGLRDTRLAERLQLDPELTLEKAVNQARQTEAVKTQQVLLRDDQSSYGAKETVDAVHKSKFYRKKEQQIRKDQGHTATPNETCPRFGKSPSHARNSCPSKDAVCRKCTKKGHFAKVCYSKFVVAVEQQGEDSDFSEVFSAPKEVDSKKWFTTVEVCGTQIKFKMDTGADETCIPESIYEGLKKKPKLCKPKKRLHSCNSEKLNICGMCTVALAGKKKFAVQDIYVVKDLHQSLLGGPALEALDLIKKNCVNAVNSEEKTDTEYKLRYSKLFKGLGKMPNEYIIHLKPNTKPFVCYVPRKIAHPLVPKVKAELDRMEKLRVIPKVDQPTERCSYMAVVPKGNGRVGICLDPLRLNENIFWEAYPLPGVDHILAQLSGSKVFTKLDCNSGLSQITFNKGIIFVNNIHHSF